MKQWLSQLVISDIFWPVISFVLLKVSAVVTDTLKGLRKEHTMSRAKDITAECLEAAFSQVVPDLIVALKDGKITSQEWDTIKVKTLSLATPRLEKLSNFAKEEIIDWLNIQFESLKIKFMRTIMGKEAVAPTDEAV